MHILTLNGRVLTSFTPYLDPGFGIRAVAWHPTGLFLAVGGWDDKVSVFVSWISNAYPVIDPYIGMSDLVDCRNPRHVDSASNQCGGQNLFILGSQ